MENNIQPENTNKTKYLTSSAWPEDKRNTITVKSKSHELMQQILDNNSREKITQKIYYRILDKEDLAETRL